MVLPIRTILYFPELHSSYDAFDRQRTAAYNDGTTYHYDYSGDRREKHAALTPAGQAYAHELLEPLYALEDTVFARMGDARVQEMMDAIALFNLIFEKETEVIK